MFRNILIIIFTLIYCKFVLTNYVDNSLDQPETQKIYLTDFHDVEGKEKIWVLELNDEGMDTLKLRGANEEDEDDFQFYTEPLVKNYKREHGTVVKKDAPKLAKGGNVDKKKVVAKSTVSKLDIFKYLNKFALYSKTESDGYLSDSHENDDPSIALYFKGRFTSLIVKQGMRQWHYFLPPPSLLPAWFSEDLTSNSSEGTITVPDDVTQKFYPALFRILQALLRYPV